MLYYHKLKKQTKTLKYFQNCNTNVAAFIFVIVQPKISCHNLDILQFSIIFGTFFVSARTKTDSSKHPQLHNRSYKTELQYEN